MITHEDSQSSLSTSFHSTDYHTKLQQLRHDILVRYRPHIQEGPGPIRVMARIVAELQQECRVAGIPEHIIQAEIVNRTIGDINLRLITEHEGEAGGPQDYRTLADEMGIALPGEHLSSYTATGTRYLWLREQMMECERLLLSQFIDPRMYDIYGIGNPILRERLAQEMRKWGLPVQKEQVGASLGAMDGIDKVLRALHVYYQAQGITDAAVLFPEPGFGVPEWQARSYGYRLHNFKTSEEHRFKITAQELDALLTEHSDIRVMYLTVTNNPTTFAYSEDELNALHAVLRKHRARGHEVTILADLAYIGTGNPAHDRARIATFTQEDVLRSTIFVSSFSKTYSLTGERFGWVTIGNADMVPAFTPAWTNTMASLPGEWQLRFMAYIRLFDTYPYLADKLRAFYKLRRQRFITQLQRIDEQLHIFKHIYLDDDATVYNWSKLQEGEDAFSLFEKTGIASVPGSGFGYSDEYVRFSIGVIPII